MQFQESGATGGTRGPVDGEERMRRMLTEAIGEALGIRPDRILSPVRGTARVALARQVAIYLARTRLGLSFTEAGRLFRRDRRPLPMPAAGSRKHATTLSSMLSSTAWMPQSPVALLRGIAHDEDGCR